MAQFAANELSYDRLEDFELAARMLTLALRFRLDDAAALLVDRKLKQGLPPSLDLPRNAMRDQPLVAQLMRCADRNAFDRRTTSAGRTLAAHLYDLVLDLAPRHQVAAMNQDRLAQEGYFVDWSGRANRFVNRVRFGQNQSPFSLDDWRIRGQQSRSSYNRTMPLSIWGAAATKDMLVARKVSGLSHQRLLAARWPLDGEFAISVQIIDAMEVGLVSVNGDDEKTLFIPGNTGAWHDYVISRRNGQVRFVVDGKLIDPDNRGTDGSEFFYFYAKLPASRGELRVRSFELDTRVGAGKVKPIVVYSAPDLSVALFDAGGFHVASVSKRRELATMLSACASNELTYERRRDSLLAARLLGIAMRLDPGNQAAAAASAKLRGGTTPDVRPIGPDDPPALAALFASIDPLAQSGASQDRLLATYLYDLARQLDPDQAATLAISQTLARAALQLDWSWTRNEPKQHKPSMPRQQSAASGLLVRRLPNGEMLGSVSDVIMTMSSTNNTPQRVTANFVRATGQEMRTSLSEAVRLARSLRPDWRGPAIDVSFGDKYSQKDGGSAGLAFSLLLLSLIDNVEIDPDCAITGDITVDGKVRSVGAVTAKLRGAMLDGCTSAVIPADNRDALADAMVLYGDELFRKVQIFAVDNIEDAVNATRADRPPYLADTMARFAKVCASIDGKNHGKLFSKKVKSELEQIVEACPAHVSANYLLQAARRQAPRKLTLSGSLQQIFIASSVVAPLLSDRSGRLGQPSIPGAVLRQTRGGLRKLERMLHRDTLPLSRAMLAFVSACETRRGGKRALEMLQRKRDAVWSLMRELSIDRAKMEKLLREGAAR